MINILAQISRSDARKSLEDKGRERRDVVERKWDSETQAGRRLGEKRGSPCRGSQLSGDRGEEVGRTRSRSTRIKGKDSQNKSMLLPSRAQQGKSKSPLVHLICPRWSKPNWNENS